MPLDGFHRQVKGRKSQPDGSASRSEGLFGEYQCEYSHIEHSTVSIAVRLVPLNCMILEVNLNIDNP